MLADIVIRRQEIEHSQFIDRDQAEMQIKRCEVQLDEENVRGNLVSEARRYLEMARVFFNKRQFAKAFLYALRAQGMTAELLAR
jgi:hypothetical protein